MRDPPRPSILAEVSVLRSVEREMRAGGSGPCESAVLQSGSVDDLTLKGGGGDREKKKKLG